MSVVQYVRKVCAVQQEKKQSCAEGEKGVCCAGMCCTVVGEVCCAIGEEGGVQ